jgi:hypothetical protein
MTDDIAEQLTKEAKKISNTSIVGQTKRKRKPKPRKDADTTPPRTIIDRIANLHEGYNQRVGLPPGSGYKR